ncbi:hypothetical protein BLOT_005382 [Blomia tropicalis]|nr:hypothetical protein BLOT_005382 [Blomia tropicalis]
MSVPVANIKNQVKIRSELKEWENGIQKKYTVGSVGITNKNDLPTTEITKGRKYKFLAGELKTMFKANSVTLIPVDMGWVSH